MYILYVRQADSIARDKEISLCLQVAECVADEFFEQGDMERNELHLEPMVSIN